MGADFPKIDAANAGNRSLRVEDADSWKLRNDVERLFELLGEHVRISAIR